MVAVAAAALVWATASPGVAAAPPVLFHLTDPRIDEASGIAVGLASPGVVYVQNDSGDEARFFALDARSGRTLATYTVPGATNVDWEDIAVAPDARGVPSVWLADIGDNSSSRAEIDVYRVNEPQVDMSAVAAAARTHAPEVWRLRYPDGPADAEGLAVSPAGAGYLFTKSLSGTAKVYALPARSDASHLQTLQARGSVHLGFTGTAGGPNRFGQRTATGAALSRDGTMLAVRTYTDAYLWHVRALNMTAAIKSKPVRLALPAQPLGEGVAFAGRGLLIDSERTGSSVYALGLPTAFTNPKPSPASSPATPTESTAADAAPGPREGPPIWQGVGAGLVIIAAFILTWRYVFADFPQWRRDRRRDRRYRH
ncbi:MAG: hypothetical protein DLM58_01810 [Pseudonocardiales bacterium]|nr:MAG: hypothetical protein DLM58_01810 [Pseudonocardiales bacterium]